jgi:flavin reductase (DIM6/NTAB) family NADH-FMN oxidoreductase RutF
MSASSPATDVSEGLRTAMRLSAQPVSVVTAGTGPDARGLTVSSFTSLSLSPPLVSFALGNETLFLPVVREGERVALHILGEDQEQTAVHFAISGRTPAEQFAGIDAAPDAWGTPALPRWTSRLSGPVERMIDAGDHVLVVFRIDDAQTAGDAPRPLLWYDRAFGRLAQAEG